MPVAIYQNPKKASNADFRLEAAGIYHFRKLRMAMEKKTPFEDVFPIDNPDFPDCHVGFSGVCC